MARFRMPKGKFLIPNSERQAIVNEIAAEFCRYFQAQGNTTVCFEDVSNNLLSMSQDGWNITIGNWINKGPASLRRIIMAHARPIDTPLQPRAAQPVITTTATPAADPASAERAETDQG